MIGLPRGRRLGTDPGVYLVKDDIFSAQEAHLMTAEDQQTLGELEPRGLDAVLHVAAAVARKREFPVDVMNTVLSFAGVLLTFQAETMEERPGRSDMNEEYLRLQLPTAEELGVPPGVDVSSCALVVADCTSKDQGWATDDIELNGTYRSCWSWHELAVSSPNELGETSEVARANFCPNLRASRNFRHHRRYFSGSTELLSHIHLGDSVALVLRSQFPGWSNHAKYGRLAVCFRVAFEDSFDFAAVSLPPAPVEAERAPGTPITCSIQ